MRPSTSVVIERVGTGSFAYKRAVLVSYFLNVTTEKQQRLVRQNILTSASLEPFLPQTIETSTPRFINGTKSSSLIAGKINY